MEFLLQLISELFSGAGAAQEETVSPTDSLQKKIVEAEAINSEITVDEQQQESIFGENNIIFNFMHFR
ncbi:MAG: hypothetical protein LBV41_11030 [Cytophagaceae bacterium]|jgi:hypothetical protein|nr:hypothetical protein [Cytophagaceae bacterium]